MGGDETGRARRDTLTASTRLPALPCDELESWPESEGTVSETGRAARRLVGGMPEAGLGLGTRLFPLLSVYLPKTNAFKSAFSTTKAVLLRAFWSHQGPQLTDGKLALSFSWELAPSNLREGTR